MNSKQVFLDDAAMMAKLDAMGGTAPAPVLVSSAPFKTFCLRFNKMHGVPVPGGPYTLLRQVRAWSRREALAVVMAEAAELHLSDEVFPILQANYDYYGIPMDVYGTFDEDGYTCKLVCVAGTKHSVKADEDVLSFIGGNLDDTMDEWDGGDHGHDPKERYACWPGRP